MIAFGKKMQVCGVLASDRLNEIEKNVFNTPSRINSTWGGNLVDMVRASKILEIIEEDDLCTNATNIGQYLKNGLMKIAENDERISNIRGRGLITAFDFEDKKIRDQFIINGLKNNVLFLGCGNSTIRFRPALIMQKQHIEEGLHLIKKILGEL